MQNSETSLPLALVTGGSKGIGKACSQALIENGFNVVITDILKSEGEEVAKNLNDKFRLTSLSSYEKTLLSLNERLEKIEAGRSLNVEHIDKARHGTNSSGLAEFYEMDVGDSVSVDSVLKNVFDKYKQPFDLIVNNAGIAKNMPLEGMTDDDWDWIHEVDLKGMLRVVRAASPHMREVKKGAIVCLSSIAGFAVGWNEHIPYCAAKAGIAGLVKGLAVELAADNIRVNGIAPGLIWTDQALDPVHSLGPEALTAAAEAGVPLKRVGQPSEIAELVCFLGSDRSSYITGQIITIDGGMTVSL